MAIPIFRLISTGFTCLRMFKKAKPLIKELRKSKKKACYVKVTETMKSTIYHDLEYYLHQVKEKNTSKSMSQFVDDINTVYGMDKSVATIKRIHRDYAKTIETEE